MEMRQLYWYQQVLSSIPVNRYAAYANTKQTEAGIPTQIPDVSTLSFPEFSVLFTAYLQTKYNTDRTLNMHQMSSSLPQPPWAHQSSPPPCRAAPL